MKDIKRRIKSVGSTRQITKAMELVSSSKLRKAKQRAEQARPYFNELYKSMCEIASANVDFSTEFTVKREVKNRLFIVIAGDRGLAGGYNANIFRLTSALVEGDDAIYLPIGKKACEYYKHRKALILGDGLPYTGEVGVSAAMSVARMICDAYIAGEIGKVVLVYTKFQSMISQVPVYEVLLPFEGEDESGESFDPIIEEDPDELLMKTVPSYAGGVIYSAVCEALASESGARRTAMNAANKNAGEMIDTLMLRFNRARQAVITQEITEIVSGAEAL